MRLYEYLIGGKKTGQIEDLKDTMSESKPFRDLKEGETFFVSLFKENGTHVYTDEIKISSIDKKRIYWAFTGFTKEGEKYIHTLELKNLDKPLYVENPPDHYQAFSTFEMEDKPFFELIKKEIKN